MGCRSCSYTPPSVWNTQQLGLGSSGNLSGLLVDCLSFICKKRWESTPVKCEIPAGLQDSPPNCLCLSPQLPVTLPLCSSHSEVLEMLISPNSTFSGLAHSLSFLLSLKCHRSLPDLPVHPPTTSTLYALSSYTFS